MVEIDLTKLAPNVANILMLRGSSLMTLCMGDHAHPQANGMIDAMADDELFGVAQISSVDMAMAIRSMLFVRNGWLTEGSMFAMMASPAESEFICGIAERNLGHLDRAKVHFQKINDHPVFETLHTHILNTLDNSMDKRLSRLHDIMKLHGNWEPYAFIDVYGEAAAGQMSSASQKTVRTIQQTEFNALFLYCYQQLMGIDARKAEVQQTPEAPRRRPVPTTRQTSHQSAPSPSPTPASKPDAMPSKPASNDVRVGCPKCKAIQSFDASQRGQKVQCSKCAVSFTIPGGSASPSAAAPSNLVRVACPKCRVPAAYPQTKRGSKVQCSKCGAAYTIPSRSAA
jgi:ribosomal protein S27E